MKNILSLSLCCLAMVCSIHGNAQTADDYLDMAKENLFHWQPDQAIAHLERCSQLSAADTAMLMTCLDYTAAAWCEKGDVFFFNEFGRQARDLWDEWQPDSEAMIPWISSSIDGCLAQILNWGADMPLDEQQRVREQARQMMERTFGPQSDHYRNWLSSWQEQ
ncbi:MAG: hypothetical protein MJZ48_00260 [Paludibacteraceae bacterium]|nr:hypothetical protein [Paludibacteraceae bacterium]